MSAMTDVLVGEIEAFLKCRVYRHAWDDFAPIDWEPPAYGWRLSLRCVRCGTERHDNFDFKNRLMSRRYLYPHGYKRKPMPQVEFREELFDRLRAKLEAGNQIGAEPPVPIKRARKKATASA